MTEPVLQANDLHFAYGENVVISDLSLSLTPGEFVGLLGPNGAGKSTLLRLLLGFIEPKRGHVKLGGEDINTLARPEIARRASFVPQSGMPEFEFRVHEIVAMGRTPYLGRFQPLRKTDRQAIRRAMQETNIAAMADRPAQALSGGEQQRVLLARAFAQETPVLLLDEPNANLDLRHAHQMMSLLRRRASQGTTVVAALHDMSMTMQYCDRVLLVDRGELIAHGPPNEVLTPERIESVYGVAASWVTAGDERRLLDIAPPPALPKKD